MPKVQKDFNEFEGELGDMRNQARSAAINRISSLAEENKLKKK